MKKLDLHRLLAMLLSVVMLLNMNYAVMAEDTLVPSPDAGGIGPTPDTGSCEHVVDCMGVCAVCGQTGFDPTEGHAWELNGFGEEVHNWLCSVCGGTTTGMHFTYCDAEGDGCHACGWIGVVKDIFHYSTQETYAYDDSQHWFACTKCGEKWMPTNHTVDATTGACTVCGYTGDACVHDEINCVGTCCNCGATGLTPEDRHTWADYFNCSNNAEHWRTCRDCGVETVREKHYYNCDAETIACVGCFRSDVVFDYVSHLDANWWKTYGWDETQHWFDCDSCDEKISPAEHAVSCVTGACTICGVTGVESENRSHSIDYSAYEYDADYHWNFCAGCDERVNEWEHMVDCSTGNCTACGAEGVNGFVVHVYDMENYYHDDTAHWRACKNCGNKSYNGYHTYYCVTGACEICGQADVTFGAFYHEGLDSSTYVYDETQHWYDCAGCDEKVNAEAHIIDCETDACTWCGAAGVESDKRLHNWDYEAYGYDANQHWYICTGCDAGTEEAAHEIDCVTGACKICGMANGTGEKQHIFDASAYQHDETTHWQVCTACGSKINVAEHTGSCQDETDCVVCGAEGIVSEKSDHHWNEWQAGDMIHWSTCKLCGIESSDEHSAPCNTDGTCQVCGAKDTPWLRWEHGNVNYNEYGADSYIHGFVCDREGCNYLVDEDLHTVKCSNPKVCIVCGYENVAIGVFMEHDYGEWQHDSKWHWRECACGEQIKSSHFASCLSNNACHECGAKDVTFEFSGHVATELWGTSAAGHFGVCTFCDQQIGELEPHYYYCGSLAENCYACGLMRTSANGITLEVHHSMSGRYQYDENCHWYECRNCGEKTEEPHEISCSSGGCSICGAADVQGEITHFRWGTYEYDAENHWFVCADCGEKFDVEAHEPDSKGDCICGATGLITVTPTPEPTAEPTATAEPTVAPTATPTAEPTAEPTEIPTATPTAEPTVEPTAAPTAEPTATPTTVPTATPTAEPTAAPTTSPTAEPSATPTAVPTATPTAAPTAEPTAEPTAAPTAEPTAEPTAAPTAEPTAEPTAAPTAEPTAEPTAAPTAEPTAEPTAAPTAEPTAEPTAAPTAEPTAEPTAAPTAEPTVEPTAAPTAEPTVAPTATPTAVPTAIPTAVPTAVPTVEPTVEPTAEPTATPTPASVPVIVPEKVENKEIEELEQEISKVVDNIIAEIQAAVKAETEAAVEGESEKVPEDMAESELETEILVKIEVPVEPLKEAVGEETYEQIVQMPVHEKIVVLLSVLDNSEGRSNLLQDTGMAISEESKAVVETVIQSVGALDEESTAIFQQMLEESFPKQEVKIDDNELVYYLIPMYITTNDVTQVKYYAFCLDMQTGKWMFTIVEEGMDVVEAIEQAQHNAADEAAE